MGGHGYSAIRDRIVPGLRSNQAIYEEELARWIGTDSIWLDAGCGHHILPVWRQDAE